MATEISSNSMMTHSRFAQNKKNIHLGKFKDRSPEHRPAGKLTDTSDTAGICLQPQDARPGSPESVRRFRDYNWPEAGVSKVFYSKAHDKERYISKAMSHGVSTQPSNFASESINPPPKTLFQQRLQDRKEQVYSSHQKAPLGMSHDQNPGLPTNLDSRYFTFGLPTELDIGAAGLINPDKTTGELHQESEICRDLYKKSHHNYKVGEQVSRDYSNQFADTKLFGIPTPHYNDGRRVESSLKWLHETQSERRTKTVSKRVDDFRERNQPQLGKVHDPIKDTMNLADDHTFGVLGKPDDYGAGDLIHARIPGTYLRGAERHRGVLAAIRHHLKKANYQNFHDLLAAFKFYDKNNKGRIDINDLREVCCQFQLPIDEQMLEQLLNYCDSNNDGFIDYLEFANFLNWKDKIPTGMYQESPGQVDTRDKSVIKSDDLRPNPHSDRETTPRRLRKQIDRSVADNRTSASMVSAVVGGVSTEDYRCYGVPTIRTDLPAPRISRVLDDRKNYGDQSNVHGLVTPSIYSQKGVFENDFLQPRTKGELRGIFNRIGLVSSDEDFERLYKLAERQHPQGHVSVESMRNLIDVAQVQ